METFKIFWGLKLAHLIFSASEQLSTNLQAKNTLVFDGTQGARMLISHFKSLRDELKFNRYYEDIMQQSANVTDEPVLPRYRKTPKDRYRHLYFEALKLACGEVERRFEQPDFLIIENLETTLIKSANGDKIVPDESLLKYLEGDIDKD